jgi:hypothetical protein
MRTVKILKGAVVAGRGKTTFMRTASVVFSLALSLIACGTSHDSAPPTESDAQPFTRVTPASSATQAERGVVQWIAIYNPNGEMSVGGADASNIVRVAFNARPNQSILQDANGTFEIDLDGTKVVSSTFNGNAAALRTLELIAMDLAPSDDTSPPAATSRPAVFGQLHLNDTTTLDDGCTKGDLVAGCARLFHDNCMKDKFDDCMHDSGSLAAAQARTDACLANWSPGGNAWKHYQVTHGDAFGNDVIISYRTDEGAIKDGRQNCIDNVNVLGFSNPASDWRNRLNDHGCYGCATQWLITRDTLEKCTHPTRVSHWFYGEDICQPTIQTINQ